MRIVWRVALVSVLTVPGWCSTLYSNGPIDGEDSAYTISGDVNVSDSFVISDDSIVTGASNIGLWVIEPYAPLTLNWTISTSPAGGGTVEGSGSDVSLSTNFFGVSPDNHDVYSASFSIPSLDLAAGTYYLELSDATAQNSEAVFWDQNGGPSIAYQNGEGPLASNSFEIDGAVATPEPSSAALSLLGIALMMLVARLRKRPSI
jgi:hypothetical protein